MYVVEEAGVYVCMLLAHLLQQTVQQTNLQQASPVDGDKELATPAMSTLHGHLALLHAILAHHRGKDASSLLKGYEKGCMPASECVNA